MTTGGSWNGSLGGALSHTNTEVRLDLPMLVLGPLPLLVLVGRRAPSGRRPGLFGEKDGCPSSVATETEGSAWVYVRGCKDNQCLPLTFLIIQRVNVFGVPPHVPSQDGVSLPLLQPGPLFGYGQCQQFPPLPI